MARRDIVVIGGSAGAVEGASEIVRGLPGDFPAAVFGVVHFPGSAHSALPRILNRAGVVPAHHPRNEEPIRQRGDEVSEANRFLQTVPTGLRVSRSSIGSSGFSPGAAMPRSSGECARTFSRLLGADGAITGAILLIEEGGETRPPAWRASSA